MSESPESGALSLSSAARHIDFHSSRRIYVVLVAHSIALSLHYAEQVCLSVCLSLSLVSLRFLHYSANSYWADLCERVTESVHSARGVLISFIWQVKRVIFCISMSDEYNLNVYESLMPIYFPTHAPLDAPEPPKQPQTQPQPQTDLTAESATAVAQVQSQKTTGSPNAPSEL